MFKNCRFSSVQLSLLPIDFSSSWWKVISCQKMLVIMISFFTMLPHLFWSVSPFLIAWIFNTASLHVCMWIFLVWVSINFLETYGYRLNAKFQLQIIHSIHQNAHQYLLTVDPRFHVHRSSGAILGKIDRAARGYEDLLDQILLEFAPLAIGIVTTLLVMLYYSLTLFFIVSLLFLVIIFAGYWCAKYVSQPLEKKFIETDDAFRSTAVENVAQVHLIRATFASDFISQKLTKNIKVNMYAEDRVWMVYAYVYTGLRLTYLIAFFCVIVMLFLQVRSGLTTSVSATALAVAYIRNTQSLLRIMGPFRRYMRGQTAVKDLFDFIPNFGKQSYPVLGHSKEMVSSLDKLSIRAKNISFDYSNAKLFNQHSFSIECSEEQTNKLFGIIGASGSGKTTLISILGGQLNPIIGEVCVNDVNIYTISDESRRKLICLQGQTATTMKGNIRYNLLFGLPPEHNFTDTDLNQLLARVGLFSIFEAYGGLNTELGEGGLNLSGGQRQRLNFASLYLRAKFFSPAVILIDEPTSSLDEISEASITSMIKELATRAITIVIAHRLKTIENAVGIIDLSLLSEEKEIKSYSSTELMKRSKYYSQLLEGKIRLDS